VIFAVLAFGQLFGFLGVLLALPISSVLMVLLRYLHERYVDSALYDERAAAAAEHAPVTLELEPPVAGDETRDEQPPPE
ncbi:MAG TPA: AI-2E family transporter, partial [Rhodanobacteraceae bacterium]|nr:AI-2E family transporter [Rhodanobacteraceae bacterium]